jgi:P4 family phage/plasmid primase-like protien
MVNREELLQGALEAAANGWRVAPIAVNSKLPIRDRSWKGEATADPNRIAEIWSETPYNIAGVTGRYLAIDVDVAGEKQGAQSLERLADEFGYLDTRVHRTPTGGFHYIYECPPDWTLTHKAPLHTDYPGIDLRAGTSYIVLPPSETAVGRYWVETDIAPNPAPDWIKTLHDGRSRAEVEHAGDRVRLDEIPPGMEGARNVTLTRLAGRLRRQGNSQTHIIAALQAYQREWRNPIPLAQVLAIAHSSERWEPDLLGGVTPQATDVDNAQLVLLASDNNLLFRAEDARWTVWDGRKWGTDAYRGGYIGEAIDVVRGFQDSVDNAAIHKMLKRKEAMLKSANGQRGLWYVMPNLSGVTRLNDEFDADPYLLNAANGIIDLRTGALSPHDKRSRLTKIASFEYDPQADMKEWEDFVLWCCSGDAEQAHWLKVALGQSLIGEVQEAMVLFMFGTGKNGKSQLTDAIQTTLGDYGVESTAELLTAKGKDTLHTEMIASLQGARFVTCPEPEKGSYWAAARLKYLTGSDVVRARHLYGREFSFKPSHTLIVHGNYQPEVRDLGEGFRRRIKLIPFSNYVTPDIEVSNLGAKLAGPGVLRWLVEGARAFLMSKLPACQSVRAATNNYLNDQDQFARCFEDVAPRDDEGWEPTDDLYSLYRHWAEKEGLRFVETKQEMVAWLRRQGYQPMKRRRNGSYPRSGWRGLTVVTQAVDDLPA